MMIIGQMEMFAMLTLCLGISLLGCSCSTMKPLRYGVGVINGGSVKIVVEPFDIAEGPHSTVAVGQVNPGGTAGMSPFYRRPVERVTVAWRIYSTGEKGQAVVWPELPKEFTKAGGSTIFLRIFPEKQQIKVFYEILDPKTGRISVIRQSDYSSPGE
jgi:hypothetical protein